MDAQYPAQLVGWVVWGKVKSLPWWPGQVMHPNKGPPEVRKMAAMKSNAGKLLVMFLGDNKYAFLPWESVVDFTEHRERHSSTNYASKFWKLGLEEAEELIARRAGLQPATDHEPVDFATKKTNFSNLAKAWAGGSGGAAAKQQSSSGTAARTAEKPKATSGPAQSPPVQPEAAKSGVTGNTSPDTKGTRSHRASGASADDGRPKSIGGVMLEWARYMPHVAATRKGVEMTPADAALRFTRRLARGEELAECTAATTATTTTSGEHALQMLQSFMLQRRLRVVDSLVRPSAAAAAAAAAAPLESGWPGTAPGQQQQQPLECPFDGGYASPGTAGGDVLNSATVTPLVVQEVFTISNPLAVPVPSRVLEALLTGRRHPGTTSSEKGGGDAPVTPTAAAAGSAITPAAAAGRLRAAAAPGQPSASSPAPEAMDVDGAQAAAQAPGIEQQPAVAVAGAWSPEMVEVDVVLKVNGKLLPHLSVGLPLRVRRGTGGDMAQQRSGSAAPPAAGASGPQQEQRPDAAAPSRSSPPAEAPCRQGGSAVSKVQTEGPPPPPPPPPQQQQGPVEPREGGGDAPAVGPVAPPCTEEVSASQPGAAGAILPPCPRAASPPAAAGPAQAASGPCAASSPAAAAAPSHGTAPGADSSPTADAAGGALMGELDLSASLAPWLRGEVRVTSWTVCGPRLVMVAVSADRKRDGGLGGIKREARLLLAEAKERRAASPGGADEEAPEAGGSEQRLKRRLRSATSPSGPGPGTAAAAAALHQPNAGQALAASLPPGTSPRRTIPLPAPAAAAAAAGTAAQPSPPQRQQAEGSSDQDGMPQISTTGPAAAALMRSRLLQQKRAAEAAAAAAAAGSGGGGGGGAGGGGTAGAGAGGQQSGGEGSKAASSAGGVSSSGAEARVAKKVKLVRFPTTATGANGTAPGVVSRVSSGGTPAAAAAVPAATAAAAPAGGATAPPDAATAGASSGGAVARRRVSYNQLLPNGSDDGGDEAQRYSGRGAGCVTGNAGYSWSTYDAGWELSYPPWLPQPGQKGAFITVSPLLVNQNNQNNHNHHNHRQRGDPGHGSHPHHHNHHNHHHHGAAHHAPGARSSSATQAGPGHGPFRQPSHHHHSHHHHSQHSHHHHHHHHQHTNQVTVSPRYNGTGGGAGGGRAVHRRSSGYDSWHRDEQEGLAHPERRVEAWSSDAGTATDLEYGAMGTTLGQAWPGVYGTVTPVSTPGGLPQSLGTAAPEPTGPCEQILLDIRVGDEADAEAASDARLSGGGGGGGGVTSGDAAIAVTVHLPPPESGRASLSAVAAPPPLTLPLQQQSCGAAVQVATPHHNLQHQSQHAAAATSTASLHGTLYHHQHHHNHNSVSTAGGLLLLPPMTPFAEQQSTAPISPAVAATTPFSSAMAAAAMMPFSPAAAAAAAAAASISPFSGMPPADVDLAVAAAMLADRHMYVCESAALKPTGAAEAAAAGQQAAGDAAGAEGGGGAAGSLAEGASCNAAALTAAAAAAASGPSLFEGEVVRLRQECDILREQVKLRLAPGTLDPLPQQQLSYPELVSQVSERILALALQLPSLSGPAKQTFIQYSRTLMQEAAAASAASAAATAAAAAGSAATPSAGGGAATAPPPPPPSASAVASGRSLAVARVAADLVRSAAAPGLMLHPEDRWAFINLAAELLRP